MTPDAPDVAEMGDWTNEDMAAALMRFAAKCDVASLIGGRLLMPMRLEWRSASDAADDAKVFRAIAERLRARGGT